MKDNLQSTLRLDTEADRHAFIRLQREKEVLESLLTPKFAKKLATFAGMRDKEDQNG